VSNSTILVATASAVATARPCSIRNEVAYGRLAKTAFRSPAPIRVGDFGPAFAADMVHDLENPPSVSGKQLWSHPPA